MGHMYFLITPAGAERYRAITTSHIRNADGAFLVYDMSAESSFDNIDFWYESIKRATNDDIVVHLLGNKSDLRSKVISTERARLLASKYNMQGYSECSAKENTNIKETFVNFYRGKLSLSLSNLNICHKEFRLFKNSFLIKIRYL
jgi:GTPase SAR1 family protein